MLDLYALLLIVRLVGAAGLFANDTTSASSSSTASFSSNIAPSITTTPPGGCSSCTIRGGDVQVYWWPTASDGQAIETVNVNSAGFTFYSPSIYIAFETLYTENACGTGSMIPPTTIPFIQGILSTATGWHSDSTYTRSPLGLNTDWILATWVRQQDYTCTYSTTTFVQAIEGTYQSSIFPNAAALNSVYNGAYSSYTVSFNPCSPTLSAPPQIYTLKPGWSDCIRGFSGLWDPPSALTVATLGGAYNPTSTLSPKTTSQVVVTPQPVSSSAVQGPAPTSVVVAPTSMKIADPTTAVNPTTATREEGTSTDSPKAVDPPSSPIENEPTTPKGADPTTNPIEVDPTTPKAIDPPTQTHIASTTLPDAGEPTTTTKVADQPGSPKPADSTTPPQAAVPSTPNHIINPGTSTVPISDIPAPIQTDAPSIVAGFPLITISSLHPTTTTPLYAIGSQTLTPGQAATITDSSGTRIVSLQSGGSSVVVGGTTIIQGGSTITSDGHTIISGGSIHVIDPSTIAISQLSGLRTVPAPPILAISGQTLTPGSAVTLTGPSGGLQIVSLEADGSSVVVGEHSVTQTDGSTLIEPATTLPISALIVGLTTISPSPSPTPNSTPTAQPLIPGSPGLTITALSGPPHIVSLAPDGSRLVIDGSTVAASEASAVLAELGLHESVVDGGQTVVFVDGDGDAGRTQTVPSVGGVVYSMGGYAGGRGSVSATVTGSLQLSMASSSSMALETWSATSSSLGAGAATTETGTGAAGVVVSEASVKGRLKMSFILAIVLAAVLF